MNEFVSMSKLLQNRKSIKLQRFRENLDMYYIERFLFSLLSKLIVSQIVERVCKIVLLLIVAGWFLSLRRYR